MDILYCNASDYQAELKQLVWSIWGPKSNESAVPALPFVHAAASDGLGWILASSEPVAYGWLHRQTPGRGLLEIGVLPEHRRRGLGGRILAEAMKQVASWELRQLVGSIPAGNTQAAAFAERNGFQPSGSLVELVAAGDLEAPAIKIGGDYFLSRFSEFKHIPTLSALLNRAYRDCFGRPENEHGAVTVESLQADLDRNPEDEFFIMLDGLGKGVAVVRARESNRIDAPGVVAEARSHGLHLPLAARALQHQHNGRPRRMSAYSPDPDWITAYHGLGFRTAAQNLLYRRDL